MKDPKDQNDDAEVEEIDCLEAINGLYAYLDGELADPQARARFEHHLTHCKACFSRTEMETLISEKIRENATEQAPDSLRGRLKGLLDDL